MAALFALGVMSLGWMVFIAALIAIEKLLPWKAAANRSVAILLLVLGLAVAFVPENVPGLVIPGSPEAARAMESMGMDGGGTKGGGGGQGSGMSDQPSNGGMSENSMRENTAPGKAMHPDSMGGAMPPAK
jgi:hypothetical protein